MIETLRKKEWREFIQLDRRVTILLSLKNTKHKMLGGSAIVTQSIVYLY